MAANPELLFDFTPPAAPTQGKPELFVGLARDMDELRAAQRLRFRVFAEEMHAQLHGAAAAMGLDEDPFDPFCRHLIVRDRRNGEVVACMRVLLDTDAKLAGSFYSETEFDLGGLVTEPGRVMELGRVCVHPEYRGGMAIAMLWNGLARFFRINEFSRMIGCGSIPLYGDGSNALTVYNMLAEKHLAPDIYRVKPRVPLPIREATTPEQAAVPALLRAYIRLGAQICGEPSWDPDFNTADLVVLLNPANLRQRYARHFLKQG